jgi:hypothetical protein
MAARIAFSIATELGKEFVTGGRNEDFGVEQAVTRLATFHALVGV